MSRKGGRRRSAHSIFMEEGSHLFITIRMAKDQNHKIRTLKELNVQLSLSIYIFVIVTIFI